MPIEIVKVNPKKKEKGEKIDPILKGLEIRYFLASHLNINEPGFVVRYGGQPQNEISQKVIASALEKGTYNSILEAKNYIRDEVKKEKEKKNK